MITYDCIRPKLGGERLAAGYYGELRCLHSVISKRTSAAHKTYIRAGRSAGYPARMQSDDLSAEQARIIKARLAPALDYLARLRARMVAGGFPPQDPLLVEVVRAEHAVQDLHVALHYLTCRDHVGRLRSGRNHSGASNSGISPSPDSKTT